MVVPSMHGVGAVEPDWLPNRHLSQRHPGRPVPHRAATDRLERPVQRLEVHGLRAGCEGVEVVGKVAGHLASRRRRRRRARQHWGDVGHTVHLGGQRHHLVAADVDGDHVAAVAVGTGTSTAAKDRGGVSDQEGSVGGRVRPATRVGVCAGRLEVRPPAPQSRRAQRSRPEDVNWPSHSDCKHQSYVAGYSPGMATEEGVSSSVHITRRMLGWHRARGNEKWPTSNVEVAVQYKLDLLGRSGVVLREELLPPLPLVRVLPRDLLDHDCQPGPGTVHQGDLKAKRPMMLHIF